MTWQGISIGVESTETAQNGIRATVDQAAKLTTRDFTDGGESKTFRIVQYVNKTDRDTLLNAYTNNRHSTQTLTWPRDNETYTVKFLQAPKSEPLGAQRYRVTTELQQWESIIYLTDGVGEILTDGAGESLRTG